MSLCGPAIARSLGLDDRTAQALIEAYTVRQALAAPVFQIDEIE